MDSEKQQQSPGPSSVLDPKKSQYLQYIKNESKEGKEEFSLIFDDENKRVQQVVEKENQRIMQEMRTNGTIKVCPLCLDEIPAIKYNDKWKSESCGMTMLCCGVIHCSHCKDKSLEFIFGKSKNTKCYNCREPIRTSFDWSKTIKPNDKRSWLLHAVGYEYMNGTGGFKKDIKKKAMKFYKKAAELGNVYAQDELAFYSFKDYRDSDTTKSFEAFEEVICYIKKAADQGAVNSQYMLAAMFMKLNRNHEEGFQLMTLAAFQGHQKARSALAFYYEQMFQKMSSVRDEAWKKNLLLTVYWYGKGAEVKKIHSEGSQSLPKMSLHLDLAMRSLWHPRDDDNRDPLPGYSHVPFCTLALAKGGQQTPLIFSKSPFDCWKYRCANCGTKSREKQEFKACARCKAFHYCRKKCQVQHWKAGHKIDCKGHWIEEFFPNIRKTHTGR
jgi:hypothetical protein